MPRTTKTTRHANGSGSIRKRKKRNKDGSSHEYWEGRVTVGYDLGCGKQLQRTVTGKTQKEVQKKMQEIAVEVNNGTYRKPCRITLGNWLDIWTESYLINCKPRTVDIYKSDIRLHIKPALAAVNLDELTPHMIQSFYNRLLHPKDGAKSLSPKSIKNIHGVLHRALKQAVINDLISRNPAENCTLPRQEKPKIKPLDQQDIARFLKEIYGTRFEVLFCVALFTGMRQGELLGLTWDCVDFTRKQITVNKQMQLHQEKGVNAYELIPTKNGRERIVPIADSIMELLKQHQSIQSQQRCATGGDWGNSHNLVFTDEIGCHLTKSTLSREYKRLVTSIGRADVRFHDLRHSYAVIAIQMGENIKTIQENMGHASAAFTLDVYGHATEAMRKESAARIERFIQQTTGVAV